MRAFVTTKEHYCPLVEKNIIIERTVVGNSEAREVCLNSHECHCGKKCGNKLLDKALRFSK